MFARALLLVALLAASGCAHRIQVVTAPAGAVVTLGKKKRIAAAPGVLRVRPFGSRRLGVQLVGYRPVEVRLAPGAGTWGFVGELVTLRWFRMLGIRVHSTYEIRLVPEHGGAGTWGPEDVP